MWAVKLQTQLEEGDKCPVLKKWTDGNLRKEVDMFVDSGVNQVLGRVDVQQRVLVHGRLSKWLVCSHK